MTIKLGLDQSLYKLPFIVMERLVIRGAYDWTVQDFSLVILNWIYLIDIKAVLFSKQLGRSNDIRTRDINLGVISIAENI